MSSDLEPIPIVDAEPPNPGVRRSTKATAAAVAAAVVTAVLALGLLLTRAEVRRLERRLDDRYGCVRSDGAFMDDQLVVVPDVLGQRLATAGVMLRAALVDGAVYGSDPQEAGAMVIAQEPGAGTCVPVGSDVGMRTQLQP